MPDSSVADIGILPTYAQRDTLDVNTQPRSEHNISTGSLHGHGHFDPSLTFYTRSWISNERPSLLFDLATGWLIQPETLLPGVTTLTRLISEVRNDPQIGCGSDCVGIADAEQVGKLETLLQVPEDHELPALTGTAKDR